MYKVNKILVTFRKINIYEIIVLNIKQSIYFIS